MASTSRKPLMVSRENKENAITFTGPGKKPFSSLVALASESLDDCCPQWSNDKFPKSHVIPPVFTFKNPELSQEVMTNLTTHHRLLGIKAPSVVNPRQAEDAEYLVYRVLDQVKLDGIIDPFLAIRGLDMKLNPKNNGNLKGDLVRMFPKYPWGEYQKQVRALFCDHERSGNCEFDYLIIGPKIGIVIVEVKSSYFNSLDDFRKQYFYGVGQLMASGAFIHFLHGVTNVALPSNIPVRTVLFCPNLTREKYEIWKSKITVDEAGWIEKVDHRIFKDDAMNSIDQEGKMDYYSRFMDILQGCSSSDRFLWDWYIAYGRILAAISSIVVLKHGIGLSEAIVKETSRISTQNPRRGEKNKDVSSYSNLAKASDLAADTAEAFHRLDIIYLSFDQQKVMAGSNRQLILGAAGTGKTILLQAKAMEIVRNGGSILVLTPECTHSRWRSIFPNSSENICDLKSFINASTDLLNSGWVQEMTRNGIVFNNYTSFNNRQCTRLCEYLGLTDQKPLHIFLDDALSEESLEEESILLMALFLMALSNHVSPQSGVWVALDPNQIRDDAYASRWSYKSSITPQLVNRAIEENICSQSVLNQVLRCSSGVFDQAYTTDINWPRDNFSLLSLDNYKPSLGHKIMGIPGTLIKEECYGRDQLVKKTSLKLSGIIGDLREHGIPLNHMCVVLTGSPDIPISQNLVCCITEGLERLLPGHTVLKPADDYRNLENTLTVATLLDVHSLEWPVVIHVSFLNGPSMGRGFENYFARSRAITVLIDLQVCIKNGE